MLDRRPCRTTWGRSPLSLAEANTFLSDGGYGLRVRGDPSGEVRLTGPGAGTGLPLGVSPTWTDLLHALVRLRRTRQHHDPGWLDRVARSLEGAAPAPNWIALPEKRVRWRTATDEAEVPAPRDVPDLRAVPGPRANTAAGADEEPHPALRGCLDGLRTENAEILVPDSPAAAAPGVRLSPSDRDGAERQLAGSARLESVVDNDPILRMYCALQRCPAALMDTARDAATVARLTEPAPPHPEHPGGTLAVSVSALVADDLLRQVIANRFERGEEELGYFLEHFIRPPLRAFRIALDTYRIALACWDLTSVGIELSPELRATGRIVLTDHGRVDTSATRAAHNGAHGLLAALEALSTAFGKLHPAARDPFPTRVRTAVDRVIAEELRYLRPRTAELLRTGDNPLRCFAHTVPAAQDELLKGVLRTVQERTRIRRRNPRVPKPTVVIDLDLCGLVPLQRTWDATRAVSGPRPGAPRGIPELADPASLTLLPTYAESTWLDFVELNGLDTRYPDVDWEAVYAEFFDAFARPWERMRTDAVNAGLARFVWDVHDAGGRVVFCTGRRERVRRYTEEALTEGGVPDAVLVCMPDDRARPISQLKVERLRELGKLDVVAVFDDMLANRVALAEEFSGALAVAVELPGVTTERQPGQPLPDGAPVIATFETTPRPTSEPSLSHTHSLEELQLGALRRNRPVQHWAATLSRAETARVIDSVLADVDVAAERTGRRARAKAGLDAEHGPDEHAERLITALHHVFTRKQFLKGSRSNYQRQDMLRDALRFVRSHRPIEVVLLGFPVKQCLNRLKAFGPLPDLAELGSLARLREMRQAVRAVYPPGLHFNILTDGRHFRPRPSAVTGAYSRKLREYADLVGISEHATIQEIDELARDRLSPDLWASRPARIAHHRDRLERALREFDITDDPLRTLERIEGSPVMAEPPFGLFRDMLMSVVYSVPMPLPPGVDRLTWSALVYSDLYNVTDRSAPESVRRARVAILRRAWHTVIRYLATLRVDDELGYEDLLPHRVRLTVSAARRGRCGFTYLGGSGLLPWQGTGVIDRRGQLAVDFSVALADQVFVPVYSPLLGPGQPWAMVPAQYTRTGRDGTRVDPAVLSAVRLRRR